GAGGPEARSHACSHADPAPGAGPSAVRRSDAARCEPSRPRRPRARRTKLAPATRAGSRDGERCSPRRPHHHRAHRGAGTSRGRASRRAARARERAEKGHLRGLHEATRRRELMSNTLAIAAVTATLQRLLQKELSRLGTGLVSDARAKVVRPTTQAEIGFQKGVSIYLYQVLPNAAGRNLDLPTRGSDGKLVKRPSAALDLMYLL